MGLVNLPYTLTAGQPENVNQLNSNLSAITAEVNGNLVDANLNKSAISFFLKLATNADRKVAFGSGSVSFAGANSAAVSVTHGLGATPVIVIGAPYYNGTGLFFGVYFQGASSIGSTTFTANMQGTGGALTGTVNFYWLAIA